MFKLLFYKNSFYICLLPKTNLLTALSSLNNTSNSVCEEQNYNAVYKDNAKALRNFIYYRCGDLDQAEDMTHEALISLWENCVKVPFEKARAFLYRVARNLIIDGARHEKVKLEFTKSSISGVGENPEQTYLKAEFEKRLESAISALPDGQREAFLMNRMDKLSYQEIADALDISVKAVEKRMHLALQSLKEQVAELNFIKI